MNGNKKLGVFKVKCLKCYGDIEIYSIGFKNCAAPDDPCKWCNDPNPKNRKFINGSFKEFTIH